MRKTRRDEAGRESGAVGGRGCLEESVAQKAKVANYY